MTPERWAQVKDLLAAAMETSEADRPRFLKAACSGDTELRAVVEELLEDNQQPSLQSPVARLVPAAVELARGDSVAHYRLEAELGKGGMGVVYRAFDTRLHRDVALKVLLPEHSDDPTRRRRLMREARAASALNHPGIVTVYDTGSERGVDFIAMEYVEGQTLNHVIPPKGLPLERALGYAGEIAEALEKAHAAGVIHRDLKPGNIMLSGDGRVKLLDFGLARRAPLEGSGSATSTVEGEIAGTVGYMSPEQVRGDPLDHRTDLFSLGVVLYEMVTGGRPFTGSSAMAICSAILNDPPRDFVGAKMPGKLKAIIRKLLEKDPGNRYANTRKVVQELKALAPARPAKLSRRAWIAVGAAAILVSLLAGRVWRRSERERWARDATPEIERLVDAQEYVKAAALIRGARAVLPKDPTLEKLWVKATGEVTITSQPSGAEVWMRLYSGDSNAWQAFGKTPLEKIRVPHAVYAWRVVKPGFAGVSFIDSPPLLLPGFRGVMNRKIKLRSAGRVPPEMVPVASEWARLAHPFSQAPIGEVGEFLIDRHEVTNEEYKKFVDAGGYQKREYWKQPFVRNGRTVPWEEAIALFRDTTERPGPATWEVGDYPNGREKYPVAGVSWYEAAAYAEFAGKSLPTAYHWTYASQSTSYAPVITPGSNFRREGPQLVGGEGALSGWGTTDMAGNVKEWCWNETEEAKRALMGGGFGEPKYMFHFGDAQSPWDRSANFGFRCVKLDSPAAPSVAGRIEVKIRDYWKERPVRDEVFKAYSELYAYDKGELNARVEETVRMPGWSLEKVTFDAAYGRERIIARLYLPKNASPPFQVVVYFPAGFAFLDDKPDLAGLEETRGFLLKSGRALIFPVYKGTYERRDGYSPLRNPPAFLRDHVIAWSKDLGRSLDYLETRKDIDTTKVAYLADSAGGPRGVILPAVEKRIKTLILGGGGLQLTENYLPEAEPVNFAKHLTIPVLMLNGRYDSYFPVETSQRPLFHLFGAPDSRKKHVIYEGGHAAYAGPAGVRECLDWLDKHMGPVRR